MPCRSAERKSLSVFVSRLSVSEFALHPELIVLGTVSGSIAYLAGEEEPPEVSRVLKGLTRKRTDLIRTVYARMEAEAVRLGASGVLGLHETRREIAPEVWEHSVQGTAVQTGTARTKGERPFLTTFSGQDYFALTAAGYRPVGIALGICVYYQKFHQRVQQNISDTRQNVERSDFTRGLYTARQNAMVALEAEAAVLNAAGVLGITVATERTLREVGRATVGMTIEFTALGTAVVPAAEKTPTVTHSLFL